jgi:hypothetical protein
LFRQFGNFDAKAHDRLAVVQAQRQRLAGRFEFLEQGRNAFSRHLGFRHQSAHNFGSSLVNLERYR